MPTCPQWWSAGSSTSNNDRDIRRLTTDLSPPRRRQRHRADPNNPGSQRLVLDTIEGTSHANLQQAVLYKEAPSRDAFCEQIKRALGRSKDLVQQLELKDLGI